MEGPLGGAIVLLAWLVSIACVFVYARVTELDPESVFPACVFAPVVLVAVIVATPLWCHCQQKDYF